MKLLMTLIATVLTLRCLTADAVAADLVTDVRFLEMTSIERTALNDTSGKLHEEPTKFTPYNVSRPKIPRRVEVFGDRYEYLANDPVGQFLVYFIGQNYSAKGARLRIEVLAGEGSKAKVAATQTIAPITEPKVAFLVRVADLAPGNYRLRARLEGVPGARAIPDFAFKKSAEQRRVMPYPEAGVPLVVHEQSHVPDGSWNITTGVPLPLQAANSTDRFVLTENGTPIPAQFSTRATWYPKEQIKWMGLDFAAKYDGGKPRSYRLMRLPAGQKPPAIASPLKVRDAGDNFVVETGAIRFQVGKRKFAGVEHVALIGADVTSGPELLGTGQGPFLMDERNVRYTAANDAQVKVTIEEAGPVKVSINATGWYTSDSDEKCNIFQTRITAYANQNRIDINHRTINTFDSDEKKLRELGFGLQPLQAKGYRFEGDGKSFAGDLPQPIKDRNNRVIPAETVWLHQDRHDHFRVMQGESKPLGEGKQSDGAAAITTAAGSVGLLVRNVWQMFPKEIELSQNELNLHVWPRHGHIAFTDAEALEQFHIYQIRYAHEGDYLDLKLPQKYFDALKSYGPILEQQDINAISANARGTATTTEFALLFQADPQAPNLVAQAKLLQQDPHAITDPIYNGLTEVEGRFAGRNPQRFPELEKALDLGFRGHSMSPDILQDYGMWIWPDTHNNWGPSHHYVQLHRWWHNSHYQDVWEYLFLYWRSGTPFIGDWARENSRHFMDIGTVNYDDPRSPMKGKLTGASYHTKGFLPWGSPRYGEHTGDDYVEVGAHFVNPDAGMFRYLLLGDHRGRDLMRSWGRAFEYAALPPERSRECVSTLGEMMSYYTNTWDPQALLYIHDLVDDMDSRPWKEVPAFPGHPMFHDRWVDRYWSFTRDPLLKQRILEWFTPQSPYGYGNARQLLYQWTGNKEYLTSHAKAYAGIARGLYENPDDPLNGFGGKSLFFPTPSQGILAPYFMQALIDANVEIPAPRDEDIPPVTAPYLPPKNSPQNWFVGPTAATGYLAARGAQPVVNLEVSGYTFTQYGMFMSNPGYIRIADATGKVLLETTVLDTSLRPTASITLDPATSKPPWKISRDGINIMKWTGSADAVVFAPTAEQAMTMEVKK